MEKVNKLKEVFNQMVELKNLEELVVNNMVAYIESEVLPYESNPFEMVSTYKPGMFDEVDEIPQEYIEVEEMVGFLCEALPHLREVCEVYRLIYCARCS